VHTRIHEANRNWPARYGPWPDGDDEPGIAQWRQAANAAIKSGSDPAIVATAVRDAIVDGRFWILTHPEFGGAILDKYSRAVEERDPRLPAGG
jgi:hypothetical protein